MVDTILSELRALLLLPRFGGKSTLTGTVMPSWLLGKQPETESIAFVTHTQKYSEDFVRATKDIIERNPYYRAAFPNLETVKSSQNQVVLLRKIEKKIPSLEGLGVGCAAIGRHPNRWLIDDVIDRRKAESIAMTRDVKDWFKFELLPALGEGQQVIVVGTRWRFNDLYNDIIKEGKFKVIHVEAIGSEKTELGKQRLGESYWPKIWPLEALLRKKAEVGIYAWMSQYMNDPMLEEGSVFRTEWLRYWHELNFDPEHGVFKLPPRDQLRIIQGVDLAIGEERSADFFVIATIGISKEGDIDILDYIRGHYDVAAQIKLIEAQAAAWKPEKIVIEANAYQMALVQFLKPTLLPVVPVKQSRDKVMRIQSLVPHFESGRIKISKNHEDFILEYCQFRADEKHEHDDLLDAFEMAVSLAVQPKFVPGFGILEW